MKIFLTLHSPTLKDSIAGDHKHYISCMSAESRARIFRLASVALMSADPQRVPSFYFLHFCCFSLSFK